VCVAAEGRVVATGRPYTLVGQDVIHIRSDGRLAQRRDSRHSTAIFRTCNLVAGNPCAILPSQCNHVSTSVTHDHRLWCHACWERGEVSNADDEFDWHLSLLLRETINQNQRRWDALTFSSSSIRTGRDNRFGTAQAE
jgi:hypothetical protein